MSAPRVACYGRPAFRSHSNSSVLIHPVSQVGRPRHHRTDDGNGNRKPVDFAGIRPVSRGQRHAPLAVHPPSSGTGDTPAVIVPPVAIAAVVEQARADHLEAVRLQYGWGTSGVERVSESVMDTRIKLSTALRLTSQCSVALCSTHPERNALQQVEVAGTVYDLLTMQAISGGSGGGSGGGGSVDGMMPMAFSLGSLGPAVVQAIGEEEMAVLAERREAALRFVMLRQRFVSELDFDRLDKGAPGRERRQRKWMDKLLRESQGFKGKDGKSERVPLAPVSGAAATILFLREVLGMAAAWSVDPLSMLATKEQGQLVLHAVCRTSLEAQLWLAAMTDRPQLINDDGVDKAMLAAITELPGLELAVAAAVNNLVPRLGQIAVAHVHLHGKAGGPAGLIERIIGELLREVMRQAKLAGLVWAIDSTWDLADRTAAAAAPVPGLGPAPSHGLLSIGLSAGPSGAYSARDAAPPRPLGGRRAQKRGAHSARPAAKSYASRLAGVRRTFCHDAVGEPLEPQGAELLLEERPGLLPPPPPPKHQNKLASMQCMRQQLPTGQVIRDRFTTRGIDPLTKHALSLAGEAGPGGITVYAPSMGTAYEQQMARFARDQATAAAPPAVAVAVQGSFPISQPSDPASAISSSRSAPPCSLPLRLHLGTCLGARAGVGYSSASTVKPLVSE